MLGMIFSRKKSIVSTIGLCITLLVIATSASDRSNRATTANGGNIEDSQDREGGESLAWRRGSSIVEVSRYLPSIREPRNDAGHRKDRVTSSVLSEADGTKVGVENRRESRDENGVVGNRTASDGKNVRVPGNRSREDYYAQRKAAMERFYAREREIADMYARQLAIRTACNNSMAPECVSVKPGVNAGEERRIGGGRVLGKISSENGSSSDRFASAPNRYFQLLTEERKTTTTVAPEKSRGLIRNDGLSSQAGVDRNKESGTLIWNPAQSLRNSTEARSVRNLSTPSTLDAGDEGRRWGRCEGELVYRHNLILGVNNGSSALDTTFEVILQGSVCISCVEALRHGQTGRAIARLIDGGRGHRFARLGLKALENEGFSCIVQIWALNERADQCQKRSGTEEPKIHP